MPEVVKRPRGRPRKYSLVPESLTIAPNWTVEQGLAPVPMSEAYPPQLQPHLGDGDGLTVHVYFHKTMSDSREPEITTWPRNWPIPESGDFVALHGKSGFVAYRTFDVDKGILSITTR